MNKKTVLLFSLVVTLFSIMMISSVKAWPNDAIYVQDVGNREITIDGQSGDGEWTTEEEKYSESLSGLSSYAATEVKFNLVMLKNSEFLFIKLAYTLNNDEGYIGNASIGVATSTKSIISQMADTEDRKVFYHNVTDSEVFVYDLHNCKITDSCSVGGARAFTPGPLDTSQEGEGGFSYDESNGVSIFEIKIPLDGDGSAEDLEIKEGITFEFVINPYLDLFTENVGHAAMATSEIQVTFSPRPFFPRPEGPMDGLAIMFNLVFAIIIIGMSLLFYFSARNDGLAEKLYRVEITEEMANKSLLMEIGYYNSSFISMFSLFYFWGYSFIALFYGIWANWGGIGLAINIPSFLIATFAMYDLIKRNHNPQDIPEEERRKLGKEIESTGSLWIFPPAFLGLTLFMLVFIGIDVVTG